MPFIQFETIPIEIKIWSRSEIFKIKILQNYCCIFNAIDMNYKVSKWPYHFTAKQPEMFVKLWFISTSCDFFFNCSLIAIRTGSILCFNNFPLISIPQFCVYVWLHSNCLMQVWYIFYFSHIYLRIVVFHFNFIFLFTLNDLLFSSLSFKIFPVCEDKVTHKRWKKVVLLIIYNYMHCMIDLWLFFKHDCV